MAESLPQATSRTPLLRREPPLAMAKAELSLREKRASFGAVLRRMSQIAGLNKDETVAILRIDPGQYGRWLSGDENPQVWRITECDEGDEGAVKLRDAFLAAQAEVNPNACVRLVIELLNPKRRVS